jgi:hypothetical protein
VHLDSIPREEMNLRLETSRFHSMTVIAPPEMAIDSIPSSEDKKRAVLEYYAQAEEPRSNLL